MPNIARPLPVLTFCLLAWTLCNGYLVLTDGGASMDLANYLSNVLWLDGLDVSGTGQYRPPGLALYLWPWVKAFGPVTGGELAGLAANAVWPFALYALLRPRVGEWTAALIAVATATTWNIASPLAWGWLVLAGLGLALGGWWALAGLLETGRARYGMALAALASLLAFVDGVGFVLFAAVGALMVPLYAPPWAPPWRRWLAVFGWGALSVLAATPWIAWQTLRFSHGTTDGAVGFSGVAFDVRWWAVPIWGLTAVAWATLRRGPSAFRAWVCAALLVGLAGLPLIPYNITIGTPLYRASLYVTLPLIAWMGWLIARAVGRWPRYRVALVVLTVMTIAWNAWMTNALLMRVLTTRPVYAPEHAAAIAWLRAHTAPGEPVLAGGMAFGWWIEATGERRAFQTDMHLTGGVFQQESDTTWRVLAGDTVTSDGRVMVGNWPGGESRWVRLDGSWLPVTYARDGRTVYAVDRAKSWVQWYPVTQPVALGVETVTWDTVADARALGARYLAVDATPRTANHGPPPPWVEERFNGWERVFRQGSVSVYILPDEEE